MWTEYPNPQFDKIHKDMSRTFMDNEYYTPEIIESIERVLRTYIWRNPTVGYI